MAYMKKVLPLLLALAAIGALASCGSSDDDTTAGTTETAAAAADGAKEAGQQDQAEPVPTIVIRDGAPVGGVRKLEYNAGEQIRFRIRSNVADEVHVHGYDESKEIPAGGSATISFPADIEGIFEAELHGSGEQIAELRVDP